MPVSSSSRHKRASAHTITQVGYCTCGKIVRGNGGWFQHSAMHKRRKDGFHYVSYEDWRELHGKKEG